MSAKIERDVRETLLEQDLALHVPKKDLIEFLDTIRSSHLYATHRRRQ